MMIQLLRFTIVSLMIKSCFVRAICDCSTKSPNVILYINLTKLQLHIVLVMQQTKYGVLCAFIFLNPNLEEQQV